MRLLDRYVIRELTVPFLIGTVAVTLMFQANTYMFYAKNFDLKNVPPLAVFQVIYYRTPEFLAMTLPVGMALAASLAMSRLARESELTALRAAGTRILRVILPIAVFGALVAAFNFWLIERVQPTATRESNRIAYRVGFEGSLPTVNENVPLKLKRYAAFLGGVERIGENGLDIENILLVERPKPEVWMVTTARKASYRKGIWTFQDAYLRRYERERLTEARPRSDFKVDEEILVDSFSSPAVAESLSATELRKRIDLAARMGRETRSDEIKLYGKYAVPAACFVFALVAPIFAIFFARGGGFVGVLLSVVMVLLYYNAYVISTDILGRFALMSPWLAAWAPNLIFTALGLVAIRRLE